MLDYTSTRRRASFKYNFIPCFCFYALFTAFQIHTPFTYIHLRLIVPHAAINGYYKSVINTRENTHRMHAAFAI